jgi:hypothetical protein
MIFQTQRSLKHVVRILLAVILCEMVAWYWVKPGAADASVSYSFSDVSTSTKPEGGDVSISGKYMAFYDNDDSGHTQIFIKDLTTGEKTQLTNTNEAKRNPSIKGNLVVWSSYAAPLKWNVFSYNVATKETKQLNSQQGDFEQASTDGTYVVWSTPLNPKQMFLYDPKDGKDKVIGNGRIPKVAAGKVLFKNVQNDGMSLYDIATGQVFKVVDMEYGDYVSWFDFNGTYAVWFQHVGNLSKYVMIDVTHLEQGPKDLTALTQRSKEYLELTIGNKMAAWVDDKNGLPSIQGANLEKKETFELAPPSPDNRLYAFDGDRVIVRSPEGTLAYRNINRNEISDTSVGYGNPVPQSDIETQKQLGSEGGELSADHGNIILTADKGTFVKDTLVSLKRTSEKNAIVTSLRNLTAVSGSWAASFQGAVKPLTLTISFEQEDVLPQQVLKLGIYRYDENGKQWSYVGGSVDSTNRKVKVPISDPGTYALMIYNASFSDIQGHWAQQSIEILASRWILNGINDTQFAPDTPLTRAQFAKMLAGALGLKEERSASGVFADVGPDHWGRGWIAAAYKAGLVQGDNGKFAPDQEITREQMMAMLVRALNMELQAKALSEQDVSGNLRFADAAKISSWAKPYAALAVKLKLIEGDAEGIRPSDSSTRAQAAAVMLRMLNELKKL